MDFLTKNSLLRKTIVKFPGGEREFVPNRVYSISEEEFAFIKKTEKWLFSNLLKLAAPKEPKCSPMAEAFERVAEKLEAMIIRQDDKKELEAYLKDEPDASIADLVPVEIIVGDEPEEKPKKKRKQKRK